MTILKRCELCLKYIHCRIYDLVCEYLEFLQNFIDINSSNEAAKYCKKYQNKNKNINIKQINKF